jgi:hypothetical protein
MSGRDRSEFKQSERVNRREGAARLGAHEALPQTPPGGKPPETPGPLSLQFDFKSQGKLVKGTLRRQRKPPLTNFPRSGGLPEIRERGPQVTASGPLRLPLVGPEEWVQTRRENCA